MSSAHHTPVTLRGHTLRALAIAAIVGTVLLLINHGDHLAAENCAFFGLKCALTYSVPFTVSLVSALLASRVRRA